MLLSRIRQIGCREKRGCSGKNTEVLLERADIWSDHRNLLEIINSAAIFVNCQFFNLMASYEKVDTHRLQIGAELQH
jgi:hypothetical protein